MPGIHILVRGCPKLRHLEIGVDVPDSLVPVAAAVFAKSNTLLILNINSYTPNALAQAVAEETGGRMILQSTFQGLVDLELPLAAERIRDNTKTLIETVCWKILAYLMNGRTSTCLVTVVQRSWPALLLPHRHRLPLLPPRRLVLGPVVGTRTVAAVTCKSVRVARSRHPAPRNARRSIGKCTRTDVPPRTCQGTRSRISPLRRFRAPLIKPVPEILCF